MLTSRTLLFGGTFDPVHHGHLLVCRAVAEALNCNNVQLIPNAQSPHKQGLTAQTSATHRLAMLRAATAGEKFFGILTLELERGAPSYTYDTINSLLKQGLHDFCWLVGADQLPHLPRWHRAAELVQSVKFVIAARPGFAFDFDSLPAPFDQLRNAVIPAPEIQISATDIRARVRAGKSIRYLVPDPVADYIHSHGLYRDPDA